MLGSTDVQVARLFQRRIALDTAVRRGDRHGAGALAVVVLVGMRLAGARIGAARRRWRSASATGSLLALLPLAFALLATLAARDRGARRAEADAVIARAHRASLALAWALGFALFMLLAAAPARRPHDRRDRRADRRPPGGSTAGIALLQRACARSGCWSPASRPTVRPIDLARRISRAAVAVRLLHRSRPRGGRHALQCRGDRRTGCARTTITRSGWSPRTGTCRARGWNWRNALGDDVVGRSATACRASRALGCCSREYNKLSAAPGRAAGWGSAR